MARISGSRTARTTAPKATAKPKAPKKPEAKETKSAGWTPKASVGGGGGGEVGSGGGGGNFSVPTYTSRGSGGE